MKTNTENPARPRTKPPEVRREELMDPAGQLVLSRGIPDPSAAPIGGGADLAKGKFYLPFQSKEHLLAALQQRFIDDVCADLRAAIDKCPAGDWHARLRAWVFAAVDGYLDRMAL